MTIKECRADENGELCSVVAVHLEPKTENGRTVMAEIPGSEEELPCQLLLIAAGFLGPEDYVPETFGLARDGRSNVATAPGGYGTGVDQGLCRRRYAPGAVPRSVGHRRGPRRGPGGGPLPHGLYQPELNQAEAPEDALRRFFSEI